MCWGMGDRGWVMGVKFYESDALNDKWYAVVYQKLL
jgi:hypothetical protein